MMIEGEDIGRYLRAIPSLRDVSLESDDMTVEDISFTKPSKNQKDTVPPADSEGRDYDSAGVQSSLLYYFNIFVAFTAVASLVILVLTIVYAVVPEGLQHEQGKVNSKVTHKLAAVMPANYRHFVDVHDDRTASRSAIPVVWDIPGDGDVLQHILSRCMGLVAVGGALNDARQTNARNEPLEVFENNHGRFVNCFAGSKKGIERMVRKNMTASGLADVIYAPMIYEVGPSFTEAYPAKMIAMFHDPVQRVASVYHIVSKIVPKFRNKTIEEFLQTISGANNNNWMTRELSNCGLSELNEECLRVAKEVVKKKCIVGMTSDLDRSLDMIYQSLGWDAEPRKFSKCASKFKKGVGLDRLYTDLVAPGSKEYEIIAGYNSYDLELFETAKQVYAENTP